MGEASVLLGKVYGSLGQLSTWLSAVCTGAGKKFPHVFPYQSCGKNADWHRLAARVSPGMG